MLWHNQWSKRVRVCDFWLLKLSLPPKNNTVDADADADINAIVDLAYSSLYLPTSNILIPLLSSPVILTAVQHLKQCKLLFSLFLRKYYD